MVSWGNDSHQLMQLNRLPTNRNSRVIKRTHIYNFTFVNKPPYRELGHTAKQSGDVIRRHVKVLHQARRLENSAKRKMTSL